MVRISPQNKVEISRIMEMVIILQVDRTTVKILVVVCINIATEIIPVVVVVDTTKMIEIVTAVVHEDVVMIVVTGLTLVVNTVPPKVERLQSVTIKLTQRR